MEERMSNDQAISRLLMVLSRHVGEDKAIDMGELYEKVFAETWKNKISDTRRLRTIVTALRRKGVPIGSVSSKNAGGYYLVRAGSELDGYCARLRRAALNKLVMEARLRRISMPELLGQMSLNLTEGAPEDGCA